MIPADGESEFIYSEDYNSKTPTAIDVLLLAGNNEFDETQNESQRRFVSRVIFGIIVKSLPLYASKPLLPQFMKHTNRYKPNPDNEM